MVSPETSALPGGMDVQTMLTMGPQLMSIVPQLLQGLAQPAMQGQRTSAGCGAVPVPVESIHVDGLQPVADGWHARQSWCRRGRTADDGCRDWRQRVRLAGGRSGRRRYRRDRRCGTRPDFRGPGRSGPNRRPIPCRPVGRRARKPGADAPVLSAARAAASAAPASAGGSPGVAPMNGMGGARESSGGEGGPRYGTPVRVLPRPR